MTTRLQRHFPFLVLIAAVGALGLYTLYWFVQMRKFQHEVATMQNAGGGMFDIQSSATNFTGFPYRLKAEFENIELVRQRSDYTVTLNAPRLDITCLMWQPGHMIIIADRPAVSMRSRGGSRPLSLAFNADSLESSLRVMPRKVERLSFEFSNVIWTDGHTLRVPIKIADLQMHIRGSNVPSVDAKPDNKHPVIANLRVMAGTLRTGKAEPMNVDLYADLTGNVGFKDIAPMLDTWRKKNGTIELRRFNIVRPELSWSATGQLMLDKTGLIIGNGKLNTNNAAQTQALLNGQLSVDSKVAPTKDQNWRIADAILQLDAKPIAKVPFQLFDIVEP
jgi:hypothetical protein